MIILLYIARHHEQKIIFTCNAICLVLQGMIAICRGLLLPTFTSRCRGQMRWIVYDLEGSKGRCILWIERGRGVVVGLTVADILQFDPCRFAAVQCGRLQLIDRQSWSGGRQRC